MAKKIDVSSYESYGDLTGRLDQIVAEVRSKETSLETSLDLLDEAIALGSKAVELVEGLEPVLASEQLEAENDAAPAPLETNGAPAAGAPAGDDPNQPASSAVL